MEKCREKSLNLKKFRKAVKIEKLIVKIILTYENCLKGCENRGNLFELKKRPQKSLILKNCIEKLLESTKLRKKPINLVKFQEKSQNLETLRIVVKI